MQLSCEWWKNQLQHGHKTVVITEPFSPCESFSVTQWRCLSSKQFKVATSSFCPPTSMRVPTGRWSLGKVQRAPRGIFSADILFPISSINVKYRFFCCYQPVSEIYEVQRFCKDFIFIGECVYNFTLSPILYSSSLSFFGGGIHVNSNFFSL